MSALFLVNQGELIGGIGAGIAFAALFFSIAGYYIFVEWRKVQQARIEMDLKREMVQKGMSAEEIERVLKASASPHLHI